MRYDVGGENAPGTTAHEPATDATDVDMPAAVQRVRQVPQRFAQLDGQPIAAHIDTYDGVHADLQDALAELDEA